MTSQTKTRNGKLALLCAGGTGGHLFPAHALASELIRRGYDIHLVSDERIERFAEDFPASERHSLPSASLSGKSPVKLLKALYALLKGYLAGRRLVRDLKPTVVIGFGGYPTVPPVLAAATKGVPSLIHEANAVLGRANSFLARYVKAVALGLPHTSGRFSKVVLTGNPVRDSVHAAAKTPYLKPEAEKPFRFTVFGGSQGAQFFSAIVPLAVGFLTIEERERLHIVQQSRLDDETAVKSAYEAMGVSAEVSPFFADMPQRIAQSHLILSRSGASTIAEVSLIGRPAILVPYPYALDHDQAANAAALVKNQGGWVKPQSDITPQWLAGELSRLMQDKDLLVEMAQNAKAQGEPRATARLADAVDLLVERKPLTDKVLDALASQGAFEPKDKLS